MDGVADDVGGALLAFRTSGHLVLVIPEYPVKIVRSHPS
jgi:hypothetical protein